MANDSRLVTQLSRLIGLDEETVKSQVWPSLESAKDSNSAQVHLQSLLGEGPSALDFITEYVTKRFPPATVTKPEPSPTTVVPKKDDIVSAFGKSGKVYVKGSKNDLAAESLFAGKPKQKKGSAAPSPKTSSAEPSRNPSPVPSPRQVPPRPPSPVAQTSKAKDPPSLKVDVNPDMISDEAWEELGRLDHNILSLGGTTKEHKLTVTLEQGTKCFCKARIHRLSPFVPMCSRCGLVICVLNPLGKPCPSCGRSNLLDDQSRSKSIERQLESRRLLFEREMRRLSREREASSKARDQFPQMPKAATAKPKSKAGGRTGSNVISLDLKTHKATRTTRTSSKPVEESNKPARSRPQEKGWIDVYDDAFRGTRTLERPKIEGRPFANPFLAETDRPLYRPPIPTEDAAVEEKVAEELPTASTSNPEKVSATTYDGWV